MAFWTEKTNPKRQFNFKVSFGAAGSIQSYYAKTATKPSFTVNSAEHNYLQHTFYYPGRLTWNDVSMTFVDPGEGESASAEFAKLLKAMGYNIGSANDSEPKSISKSKSVDALGDVTIRQLDDEGLELDVWVLKNAWVTEVSFGDLDYSSDELTEISCTLKYDFATFQEKKAGVNTPILGVQ